MPVPPEVNLARVERVVGDSYIGSKRRRGKYIPDTPWYRS